MKRPGRRRAAVKSGYTLSRKAEEDVIEIFLQGAERFGLAQAEHYHSILERGFQFLAENPYAAHLRMEITPPVRVHPVESHIIIYTTDEVGGVFVVRVRHGGEDWLAVS